MKFAKEKIKSIEEKNKISQEIHDTIAQTLVALISQLKFIEENKENLNEKIKNLIRLSKEGLSQIRESICLLKPETTNLKNFEGSLISILKPFLLEEEKKLKIKIEGNPLSLKSEKMLDLLRISQEAIMNAIKHSKGKNIFLNLKIEKKSIILEILDDGIGIDLENLKEGFGIKTMKERAKRLKGEIKIEGEKGKGTKIWLIFPIKGNKL